MNVNRTSVFSRLRLFAFRGVASAFILICCQAGQTASYAQTPNPTQTVINYADRWKVNVPTVDPGATWRDLDFNDSAWADGPGLLGFETSALPAPGLKTTVGTAGSQMTYLFRKPFFFDGDPDNVAFSIDQIVDDGVTYYLNGVAIGSKRHIPGMWNNGSDGTVDNAIEELAAVSGAATSLLYGENVLAAEVHQSGPSSSDMVFGSKLKLTGRGLGSDYWRTLNFNSNSNSGDGADAADPDGDGMPNLMEYALARDPWGGSQGWGSTTVQSGNLILTYSRRKAALNELTFITVWSTIPSRLSTDWSSAGVTELILSDDGVTQIVQSKVPTSGAKMFLKVQVTRLPIAAPSVIPGSLTAVALSDTQVDLNWVCSSTNQTNFRIERKTGSGAFVQINRVDGTARTFRDTGLTGGITCSYRVRANNSAGDSPYSSIATVTTQTLPIAPTGLNGVVYSSTRIDLTWQDNSSTEDGFKLERRTSGSSQGYVTIATLQRDVTSYTDENGLAIGETYYYRLTAFNGVGTSDASSEWISMGVPSAPTSITAIAAPCAIVDKSQIDVSWVADLVNNETNFRVERRVSGASVTTFIQVGTTGVDTTVFQDTSVVAGTRYVYRVRAYNVIGTSAVPDPAVEARETAGPPEAPTNPTIVVVSGRLDITWVDNSNNETRFDIFRRISGDPFPATPTFTVGPNSSSYPDSTVSNGYTYIYKISAANGAGSSASTPEIRMTAGVPAAPESLTAVAASNQITLSWVDKSNSELSFVIERGSGTTFDYLATMPANSDGYVDADLPGSTTFTYRVTAFNDAGHSPFVSITKATLAAPAAPTGSIVRRALGTYQAEESINLIFVAQPNGTVRIRDTVATTVPAGYFKYYIVDETTYQGELENIGTFQPYTSVTIVKVIARGPNFYLWDDRPLPEGNDYLLPRLGGAAEVYTGIR